MKLFANVNKFRSPRAKLHVMWINLKVILRNTKIAEYLDYAEMQLLMEWQDSPTNLQIARRAFCNWFEWWKVELLGRLGMYQ